MKPGEDLETILPGEAIPATRLGPAGVAVRFTFLTFRDAAGVYWLRYPNCDLEERSAQLASTQITTRESTLGA